MTKSTIDLNSNYECYNSSIVDKYMISRGNIQIIERVQEGKFGTGNLIFFKITS